MVAISPKGLVKNTVRFEIHVFLTSKTPNLSCLTVFNFIQRFSVRYGLPAKDFQQALAGLAAKKSVSDSKTPYTCQSSLHNVWEVV